MPLYTYQCQKCKEEIVEIRTVDDRDILPKDPCPKCKAIKWIRIMCAATFKRGFNWGSGKGYWND